LLGAICGCHFTDTRAPVPDALISSRQLSQQGCAALERAQDQEAAALLAKAVKVCPVDPDARRHYAEALWQRGMRSEALKQLQEACRLAPEDAATRARLADMYLAVGQVPSARDSASQAIVLNPRLPAAWAVRGRVMRATGNAEQALADYHRSLGYAPTDRRVLVEVAELYRQLNRPQRALETLQSLAETYTAGEEPQQVLYLLGLAYVALQRYDDGVESLAGAAARENPTAEIFYRLGEAQWLAGRPVEASIALDKALALDPRHQAGRDLLARMALARQAESAPRR
jgi:tetratricopeptide (TPR) repeat protein